MQGTSRQIRSGQFGDPTVTYGYRFERLGEVFVERVIWGRLPVPRWLAGVVVADTGYVWYRFWLLRYDQIVERYYTPDGVLVGTQIDICAPLMCDAALCSAVDLILDVWIDQAGRVTIHNQEIFEHAVLLGDLGPEQARLAEDHLRELTAAIARGRFPPPLVRNWRVDPTRTGSIGAT